MHGSNDMMTKTRRDAVVARLPELTQLEEHFFGCILAKAMCLLAWVLITCTSSGYLLRCAE